MDIKAKIEEIVKKLSSDKTLLEQFKKDPSKTVSSLIGAELPEGSLEKVIEAVRAKISLDKVGDVADKLKKLF